MSKGSLKSEGAVVLDHSQRGAPSIDVVHMEHVASFEREAPPTWQGYAREARTGARTRDTRMSGRGPAEADPLPIMPSSFHDAAGLGWPGHP